MRGRCYGNKRPIDAMGRRVRASFQIDASSGPRSFRSRGCRRSASNRFCFPNARNELATIRSSPLALTLRSCVAAGEVGNVIRQAAVQHKADLVVIGRGHLGETLGRLRTNAYAVIRQSPCPVISV